jgi:hypothetical protein
VENGSFLPAWIHKVDEGGRVSPRFDVLHKSFNKVLVSGAKLNQARRVNPASLSSIPTSVQELESLL